MSSWLQIYDLGLGSVRLGFPEFGEAHLPHLAGSLGCCICLRQFYTGYFQVQLQHTQPTKQHVRMRAEGLGSHLQGVCITLRRIQTAMLILTYVLLSLEHQVRRFPPNPCNLIPRPKSPCIATNLGTRNHAPPRPDPSITAYEAPVGRERCNCDH